MKTKTLKDYCYENNIEYEYENIIDKMGINEIFYFVPFQVQRIQKALLQGDTHLNTLPIQKWDRMTGIYVNDLTGARRWTHDGLAMYLLMKYDINCLSQSECVSLLKTCAKMYCSTM